MSDSLRDQLLGLGFKPAPKPEKPHTPAKPRHDGARPPGGKPTHAGNPAHAGKPGGQQKPGGHQKPGDRPGGKPDGRGPRPQRRPEANAQRKPRTQEEIDLAKAYAIRAQREKEERIEAERVKQEEARLRREAKAKVAELVKDKGLNDPAADVARHFSYGNKIKRIYVNEAQLRQLNAGELGVVQLDGRYLLVTAALLDEAAAIFPASVALKVDPNATAEEDPYADPKYQVPDDLVW
jgi:uncharacterized protein YaiL (DUF2058 family)